MADVPSFDDLAASPAPGLDALALAIAAEFRPVDHAWALGRLDVLGTELAQSVARGDGEPEGQARACGVLLGGAYRFEGDREDYDHPDNSMLDLVLGRRRGLPILLAVVYCEVARRAEIPLAGVGLEGHFVVGHFGTDPPILLDPFSGGGPFRHEARAGLLRPWTPTEIAMRILNNLVVGFHRRGDLPAAVRSATMRLALPADPRHHDALREELRLLRAQIE